MLRILDYAKGKDIEWYEVIRQAINEAFAGPVVILTCGELRVYELDEDEMIGDYPDAKPIPLALVEYTFNPVTRVHAEHISGDNQSTENNDNVVIALKFTDGSVGNRPSSASGDKTYPREALEFFFDGKTISLRDFQFSELHGTGKTVAFKTRRQEIGYTEELQHFVNCVSGKETLLVSPEEMFATMETIFAIERSLATANAVSTT